MVNYFNLNRLEELKKATKGILRNKSSKDIVWEEIGKEVKDYPQSLKDKLNKVLKEWKINLTREEGKFKISETVRENYRTFSADRENEYESEDEYAKADGKNTWGRWKTTDKQRRSRVCGIGNKVLALIELEKTLWEAEQASETEDKTKISKIIKKLEEYSQPDIQDEYIGKIRLTNWETGKSYLQRINEYNEKLKQKQADLENQEDTPIGERNNQPEENWNLIPGITPEMVEEWQGQGFNYVQTKEWLDTGLNINQAKFAAWLRDNKKLSPDEFLNAPNIEELNGEFAAYENYERFSDTEKLAALKEEVRRLIENILADNSINFSEEIHGKWFARLEKIKTEARAVVERLRSAEILNDFSEVGKVQRLVDNGNENADELNQTYKNKVGQFLEKAKRYFITKVESFDLSDEKINGLWERYNEEFGWKEDIKGRDNIYNLMGHVNSDVIAAIEKFKKENEEKPEPEPQVPLDLNKILEEFPGIHAIVMAVDQVIFETPTSNSERKIILNFSACATRFNKNPPISTNNLRSLEISYDIEYDDKKIEETEKLLRNLPRNSVVKISLISLKNTLSKEEKIYITESDDIKEIAVEGKKKEPEKNNKNPETSAFMLLAQQIRDTEKEEVLQEISINSLEKEGKISDQEWEEKKAKLQKVLDTKFALFLDEISDKELEEFLAAREKHTEGWHIFVLNKGSIGNYLVELNKWKDFFSSDKFSKISVEKQVQNKKLWWVSGLSLQTGPLGKSTAQLAVDNGWADLTEEKISLKSGSAGLIDYEWIEGEKLQGLDLSKFKKDAIDKIAQKIGEVPTMSAEDLTTNYPKSYFVGLRSERNVPEEVIKKLEVAVESKQKGWWEVFFGKHGELSKADQLAWKNSGLNPQPNIQKKLSKVSECDNAYEKGWDHIVSPEFTKVGRGKYNYKPTGQQITVEINLLEHKKRQVDKALEIWKSIESANTLEQIGDESQITQQINSLEKDLKNFIDANDILPVGIRIKDLKDKKQEQQWIIHKNLKIQQVNDYWVHFEAKLDQTKNAVLGNDWENSIRNIEDLVFEEKKKKVNEKIIKLKRKINDCYLRCLISLAKQIVDETDANTPKPWENDNYLKAMVELGKIAKRVNQMISDANINKHTDEAIKQEIRALKEFKEFKELKDTNNVNFFRGFAWRKWEKTDELLNDLQDYLNAREKLQEAIEAKPVAGFIIFGSGGNVDLNSIRLVLGSLQKLIPKELNSSVPDNMSKPQFCAYFFKKANVDQRELELLKMEAGFVDHEGTDWGFNLSEPQKTKINNAENKTKLKEIQAEIRAENVSWGSFFQKHKITKDADKRSWKKAHPTEKGYEEAEKIYEKHLRGYSESEEWEAELTNSQKTRIIETPKVLDFAVLKEEIRWECFFAKRGISEAKEKDAWRRTELNVSEARTAYDIKKWRGLSDKKTFPKIGKEVEYNPDISGQRLTTGAACSLTSNNMEEMEKMIKLFWEINKAVSLEVLRSPEIKNIEEIYLQEETGKYNHEYIKGIWKTKELELFVKNFEAGLPSSIAKNKRLSKDEKNLCYQKWLDKTGGDGERERKWQDNGWEPDNLYLSLYAPDGFYAEFPNIIDPLNPSAEEVTIQGINPSQVRKGQLGLVRELLADIKSKTQASQLSPYSRNDEVESLADEFLPDQYKKEQVTNFFILKWAELDKQEFANQVRGEYPEVSLSDDRIYDFRNRFNGDNLYQLKAEPLVKWLKEGLNDPNIIFVDEAEKFYAEIEGRKFYLDDWTLSKAIDKVWVDDFVKYVNHANSSAIKRNLPVVVEDGVDEFDTEKILKYRKNDISPDKAGQVFINHWKDVHFDWSGSKANVPSYSSFGETDYNFCGVKVCQKELDKVNSIIKGIKEAKTLTDLISKDDVTKYKEDRVPGGKNHSWIRSFRQNKEQEIENKRRRAKVQSDITEIENELNKKPVVLVQELTNSNFQTKLFSLADQDTERKDYKGKVITEITEKRKQKLAQVYQIIANARTIFAKNDATKQKLEKAINDLKKLAKAQPDSTEKIVWEEKKTENEKLLSNLEKKLNKIDDDKENISQLPTPNQPLNPKQKKFYGEDWQILKPIQQEVKQWILRKWEEIKTKVYQKSCCSFCKKAFDWDENLSYLEARSKVLSEIENHHKNCSFKKSNQVKKITQEEWEETKKTKTRNFHSCPHCLEKIVWDKSITNVEQAQKQALADFNCHIKECAKPKNERMIKTLSENQNIQHASLDYLQGTDYSKVILEKDEQGQIWQENISIKNEPVSWTPWLVCSSILIVATGIFVLSWRLFEKQKWELDKRIGKVK